MINDGAPFGSPSCWGKQYEDGSDECSACNFKTTCRPATINAYSRRTLPVVQQQTLPQPRYGNGYAAPTLPQPGGYPPQPQPSAFPRPAMPQQPPAPQQYQVPPMQPYAPPGWNNPVSVLHRPGPPPAVPMNTQWWQYSGESTSSRLGKNVMLSMARALFGTLFEFFTNWTWPTNEDTR